MRNNAEQILGHYFSHAVGRFGDSDTQAEAAEAVADIIKRAVAEANTCLEARVAALEAQNKDLQTRLAVLEVNAYDTESGADDGLIGMAVYCESPQFEGFGLVLSVNDDDTANVESDMTGFIYRIRKEHIRVTEEE